MADLRSLPKVDVLAASAALEGYSQAVRVKAARAAIEILRMESRNGGAVSDAESLAVLEAAKLAGSSMKRIINATGVVLHTGLGRARLAESAARRIFEVAKDHAAVELDLESGERGDRQVHVRELLKELTGAEDALVVNNCAAAILLTLSSLCRGLDLILSRGEMIEIGGSFRMPEIIAESGCRLVEVGCTNKTHVKDYQTAISETTGAILRCHPSNYKVVGFVDSPTSVELKSLASDSGVLFIHDLGNGLLFDLGPFGLPKETSVQTAIAEGADVVTASGDKMLGGPQAGLILGRADLIKQIKSHPLARAMRVDKLTLVALEATLKLHAEKRLEEIPTYRYLSRSLEDIKKASQQLSRSYGGRSVVEQGFSEVGGGSVPGVGIDTWRVGLEAKDPVTLASKLRHSEPAVLARIEKGKVWLDPRTIEKDELKELGSILSKLKD